ncbi:PEGA domain-containing protein, partial [Candidatus Saccharibacteria bacterium]|nr:PEGA domain-containing protein [Candidatus Saccharibacteria bacterium]
FFSIIIYSIIHLILTAGKVKVKIMYAPFASTVILDGKEVPNNTEQYISIGSHNISVKYPNFEDLTTDVEVDSDTKFLFGILVATNSDAELYIQEHMDEFLSVQGVAGLVANEEGAKKWDEILDNYPIVAKLPIVNSLFEIKYVEQAEGGVSFVINSASAYVNSAVQKIKSLLSTDESLANYNISFEGFNNLLDGSFVANDASEPIEFLKEGFKGESTFQFVKGEYVGDYYCAIVTAGLAQEYSLVTYRIILVDNGGWNLASQPSPILTKYNSSDVPIEVLDIANNM